MVETANGHNRVSGCQDTTARGWQVTGQLGPVMGGTEIIHYSYGQWEQNVANKIKKVFR